MIIILFIIVNNFNIKIYNKYSCQELNKYTTIYILIIVSNNYTLFVKLYCYQIE